MPSKFDFSILKGVSNDDREDASIEFTMNHGDEVKEHEKTMLGYYNAAASTTCEAIRNLNSFLLAYETLYDLCSKYGIGGVAYFKEFWFNDILVKRAKEQIRLLKKGPKEITEDATRELILNAIRKSGSIQRTELFKVLPFSCSKLIAPALKKLEKEGIISAPQGTKKIIELLVR